MSGSSLTARQWNTILAALVLWAWLAKKSATHPVYQPVVKGLFGQWSPLTDQEVVEMIEILEETL